MYKLWYNHLHLILPPHLILLSTVRGRSERRSEELGCQAPSDEHEFILVFAKPRCPISWFVILYFLTYANSDLIQTNSIDGL